jgi:hypothetical protein
MRIIAAGIPPASSGIQLTEQLIEERPSYEAVKVENNCNVLPGSDLFCTCIGSQ